MVDKQIGQILEALAESGAADQTMVVFLADHGEGMASHHLVTKYGAFYEETNRVPFFFSLPAGDNKSGTPGSCNKNAVPLYKNRTASAASPLFWTWFPRFWTMQAFPARLEWKDFPHATDHGGKDPFRPNRCRGGMVR